jgi:peptide/nickel transport system permease protein
MTRFLLRRIALSVFVLFAVVTLTFLSLSLAGDPITNKMTLAGASQEDIKAALHALGYDRPVFVRYISFLGDLLVGDFGKSFIYGQNALDMVLQRFPYTLQLAAVSLAITIVVAIPLGVLAAVKRDSLLDRGIIAFAALGQAVPSFVVGPLLILLFAVALRMLPVSGAVAPGSLVLPAVTLALLPIARVIRLLRGSMLDISTADFVTTARSKGVRETVVIMRHMFRNALLPTITIIGMQIANLLGGAVIVEAIFGWPGIGSLARDSLIANDFPLVQTIVILAAATVVVVNTATDLVYSLIDPRIKAK